MNPRSLTTPRAPHLTLLDSPSPATQAKTSSDSPLCAHVRTAGQCQPDRLPELFPRLAIRTILSVLVANLRISALQTHSDPIAITSVRNMPESDRFESDGFNFGFSKNDKPFVSFQAVKDHLTLLNAFAQLKKAVQASCHSPQPSAPDPTSQLPDDRVEALPDYSDATAPPEYTYLPQAKPLSQWLLSMSGIELERAERERSDATAEIQRAYVWDNYLTRAFHRTELYLEHILTPNLVPNDSNPKHQADQLIDSKSVLPIEIPDQLLPPLDVALILHSYYLNPGRLVEDCYRFGSKLGLKWTTFPLSGLCRHLKTLVDPNDPLLGLCHHMRRCSISEDSEGSIRPPEIRAQPAQLQWELAVGGKFCQPWSLPLAPPPTAGPRVSNPQSSRSWDTSNGLYIPCPNCRMRNFVPWSSKGAEKTKKGLCEVDWEKVCVSCGLYLSQDTLQGGKFGRDLEMFTKDENFYMAGLLLDPRSGARAEKPGLADALLGPMVRMPHRPYQRKDRGSRGRRSRVREWTELPELRKIDPARLCIDKRFSMQAISSELRKKMYEMEKLNLVRGPSTALFEMRLHRILKHYFNGRACFVGGTIFGGGSTGMTHSASPSECTIDLVEAVKRQGVFIDEMSKLGWTDQLSLQHGSNDISLARAMVRYHMWLDLMSFSQRMLCPTLDIDLVWHTHQLQGSYRRDTMKNADRFVDHDDKVEATVLSDAFERTAKYWKMRYRQPYSVCGCLCPRVSAISMVKNLFLPGSNKVKGKDPTKKGSSPPVSQDVEDNLNNATHPSSHQLVMIKGKGGEARVKKLEAKYRNDVKSGRRSEDHRDAFIPGYGWMGLYPFVYMPVGAAVTVDGCSGTLGHSRIPTSHFSRR
ncbi:hypothetical protein IE53DRAFT_180792 [Violaceomyces palustris]|uniref:Uncharacterized protein n=1 Tax=Violaceomyces palustris TaxID=1673888 RepID=A0ACD0NSB7_9BASI|nr:hypothetical protein IE53DRAFT_180792 [Violaceomyces palustris]